MTNSQNEAPRSSLRGIKRNPPKPPALPCQGLGEFSVPLSSQQPAEHSATEDKIYDLIIIGAGAAGLAASIYASRYKISHLVVAHKLGGQAAWGYLIENYPGYQSISGQELMDKFTAQAQKLGVEIKPAEVLEIIKQDRGFLVTLRGEEKIQTHSLILAMGTEHKKLNIPGEKKFRAKGVSYCATCDAPLYKDRIVAVVGGGDSALTAALLLASYAKKVYLIHRRDMYKGQETWREKVVATPNIEKIFSTNLIAIKGDKVVREIVLDKPYQGAAALKVDGLFVEIGAAPSAYLAKKLGAALDDQGYIKVDQNCQTNLAGVFAAGDVTNHTRLKQILTAASQGAMATYGVYQYLNQK